MTSPEFVDTFQLWVFGNRSQRREAAAAICGRHAGASVFSLGQGHANLSGAVLEVKPRLGSTKMLSLFLVWPERAELPWGRRNQPNLLWWPLRPGEEFWLWAAQLQSACDVQLLSVQCSGRRAASSQDCVFWAHFSSALSWLFFFLFLYSASHCLFFILVINCPKYSCSWTAGVQFLCCISSELAMQVQGNLGECTHPRLAR